MHSSARTQNQWWLLAIPAVVGLLAFSVSYFSVSYLAVAFVLAGVFIASSVASVHPADAMKVYFIYLVFDGGLKIWSSYNPIIHVGSDLLLIFVTFRLITRDRDELGERFDESTYERIMSVAGFLAIFWLWVFVQFFNPWGLGILPSLASFKVYVVPMLIFFNVALLMKREEILPIPYILLILGMFNGGLAILEWQQGDQFMPSLHSGYGVAIEHFHFWGALYRPFGTTNLPGGPAMWMFHTLMAGFAAVTFLRERVDVASWIKRFWSICFWVFVPLCFATIMVCQVRTILIRAGLLLLAGLSLRSAKSFLIVLGTAVTAFVIVFSAQEITSAAKKDSRKGPTAEDQVLERSLSLNNANTWKNARDGALDGMLKLSEQTAMGIGLSRVGAASAPWSSIIATDVDFGPEWSFADNVFRAIFTELGIGGLLAYIGLMLFLLMRLASAGHYLGLLTAVYCALLLMNGFSSEGILYQPDASMFWFWAAAGLRAAPTTKA